MPFRRFSFVLPLLFSACLGLLPAQQPVYLDTHRPARERAHDLVGRMTLEEKAAQLEDWATAIPRLGIPDYQTWNEALHGVARAGYATVFPQAIGMAATWDPVHGAQHGRRDLRRKPAPSTTRRSARAITASSMA